MVITKEELAIQFRKIKRDRNRGVLNVFLSEKPTLELTQFIELLTFTETDEWSSVIRDHECGSEVLIYRPSWGADIQAMIDDAEAR